MENPIFSFDQGFEEIVIISANPIVYYLIDTLRTNKYFGRIILIEDKERILTEVPENYVDRRIAVDPDKIDETIPLINSLNAPLICVVSWFKIFSKRFITSFNSKILNVHTGDLPNYRGAGGGSWQILNGENKILSHVQKMIFEVDRGSILISEMQALPPLPYPKDVKEAGRIATKRVLIRLGFAILNNDIVHLQLQNEQNASYFPRLNSTLNGWIDFTWSVDFVERFIRAFSYPYFGASFSYLGETFRVKESWLRDSNINFHPFCFGQIINIDDNSLHVVCKSGVICLSKIFDVGGNPVSIKKFKIGKNISARSEFLIRSKLFSFYLLFILYLIDLSNVY